MSEKQPAAGFLDPRSIEQIRIGQAPRLVEIHSGPYVVATRRGYQPALVVEEIHEGKQYLLYISAGSLTQSLEEIRKRRPDGLIGVTIRIRKMSDDKMSPYEVEEQ